MASIKVAAAGDGEWRVAISEGGGVTRHSVSAAPGEIGRLGGGRSGEDVVEAAFRFLLDREPKEAVLARFDLAVIGRYFPEFERELPRYLAALR